MNIPLVDLKAQYQAIRPEIDEAIARIVTGTNFIGGKDLTAFEQAFAEYQGTKRAVGVASGTAALFLALQALEIGNGDEVITTTHTFIATVEAIEMVGAIPVLVDIDPQTYNLDPQQVELAITPQTKAIMPVHLYGQLADMDAIIAIAERHHLYIIEDAAQAHGAELHGKRAGNFGDVACFSFYPGKNLGAYGDAGAICTNNEQLADRIAMLRNHGRTGKYLHDVIGYGERLDTLQAAILSAKLPHLESWNKARQQHAATYNGLLKEIPGITIPTVMNNASHVYHIYCIQVPERRDEILAALNSQGIGAGIHYPVPVHLQPAMAHRGWKQGDFPNTEFAVNHIISLPIYPEMTEAQIHYVVEALKISLHEHLSVS